jgi:drug/metabolite transporter (DMT)-like permease
MNRLHTPTGNWKYALLLSLFSALLWGILPVALQAMMSYMDPYTITWYRFLLAGMVSFFVLACKKGIPRLRGTSNANVITLLLASIGLCGNYILYLQGLAKTGPGAAQVVIQLAPILLILGGVMIFKEAFTIRQLIGLICILIGFFSSQQILLLIFLSGTLVFLPTADPSTLLLLDGTGILLLAFCSVNTVLAYGCFAEALEHWEASRISAILAIVPLLTLIFMELAIPVFPDVVSSEKITWVSFLGAMVVVTGTVIFVIKKKKSIPRDSKAR